MVISTDVFDTLVLRKAVSERQRMARTAKMIVGHLAPHHRRTWRHIYQAKQLAHRTAFRALKARGGTGEVSHAHVTKMQLQLLNLPQSLASLFLQCELQVEKSCLTPNKKWVETLRLHRSAGGRVIAISDTPFSSENVEEIIVDVVGPNLVDRVYTSCDAQATKHRGDLFDQVLQIERLNPRMVLHVGDDTHADQIMARKAGLSSHITPRSNGHAVARSLNGVGFELRKRAAGRPVSAIAGMQTNAPIACAHEFGRRVLGPIIFEACVKLWLHLSAAPPSETKALFCARGGLRIRRAFERVVENCRLPLEMERIDFMTSRLAAAKAALLNESDEVLEEILRYYHNRKLHSFINGFGDGHSPDGIDLDQPTTRETILDFLRHPHSKPFRDYLSHHRDLYRRYIAQTVGDASHLILIDTGLHGSTLRLMVDPFPEYDWSCILLSRSYCKSRDPALIAATVGLWIEENGYTPLRPRSAIFRYYQLVEALFEPQLESVHSFYDAGNRVVSNLEVPGWEDKVVDSAIPLFEGAMAYLADLTPQDLIQCEDLAQTAWQRLCKAIRFPNRQDVELLSLPDRSLDYGLQGTFRANMVDGSARLRDTLAQIRYSSWKEGAAASAFPVLRPATNLALEMAQIARFAKAGIGRSLS